MKNSHQHGIWLFGGLTNKCSTLYRCSAKYQAKEQSRAVEYIHLH